VAGTVVLLFVAYLLWGTGLHEAKAQSSLKKQFEQSLAATTATTAPADGGTTTTTVPTPPPTGNAVAVIRIPKIGVEKAVVEGVGVPDLQKGPGHYPGTPLPGQPGNAAIAGHRTTYGAPFYNLDQLEKGDEIDVTTLQGTYRFLVDTSEVVRPDQTEVIDPTLDSRLTLTTCNPRFSSRERLVVTAILTGTPAPAPTTPSTTVGGGSSGGAALDEPALTSSGGEHAARVPSALWALACGLAAVAVHQTAKRRRSWRRWGFYLLGVVPVGLTLFVFFENVSRLLPANF
jgi:sortase A